MIDPLAISLTLLFVVVSGLGGVALARALEWSRDVTLILEHPREAWVQSVVRDLWERGEYLDASLHVLRLQTGYALCSGGGSYERVPSARLAGVLRAHWDRQYEAARAEVVVTGRSL